MRSEPDKDEPFGFEGPEIIKCKGCVCEAQMPRRSIKESVADSYICLTSLTRANAVPAQPCVGKLGISLVLLNFLHCNFGLWFKTP